jgi:hypothetical protein
MKMPLRLLRNSLVIAVFAILLIGYAVSEATVWFLSPPFPNEGGKGFSLDLLSELGGEAAVTVSKVADRWRPVIPDEEGCVDLLKCFVTTDDKVVYALATFDAKTSGIAWWRFGSDDGIKVWVNGEAVYSLTGRRGAKEDGDECFTRAVAGENVVLLKIDNGTGSRRPGHRFPEDSRRGKSSG